MGQPVVHFEIIGSDPAKLRSYYGALFGWEFATSDATTEAVSQPGNYGFVDRSTTGDGTGINGGVAGGAGYDPRRTHPGSTVPSGNSVGHGCEEG
jgi:predicted enzyme related to lactoylglutathione lyase